MIVKILDLPDDVFKRHLIRYLTVSDIIIIDNSILNHHYRILILKNLEYIILIGDLNMSLQSSLLLWLINRKIFFENIKILKINKRTQRLIRSRRSISSNSSRSSSSSSRKRKNNDTSHDYFNQFLSLLQHCNKFILADNSIEDENISKLISSEYLIQLHTFIITNHN